MHSQTKSVVVVDRWSLFSLQIRTEIEFLKWMFDCIIHRPVFTVFSLVKLVVFVLSGKKI
jgi:hypothetical protein